MRELSALADHDKVKVTLGRHKKVASTMLAELARQDKTRLEEYYREGMVEYT